MSKTLSATLESAAASFEQKVVMAVEIAYNAQTLRYTDGTETISIGGNDFVPHYISVGKVPIIGFGEGEVRVDVGNHDDAIGALALSEDVGQTIKIWEVWTTSAGQEELLVWNGKIFSQTIRLDVVNFTAKSSGGLKSRPGGAICSKKCRYAFDNTGGTERCTYEGPHTTCTRTISDCASRIFTPDASGVAGGSPTLSLGDNVRFNGMSPFFNGNPVDFEIEIDDATSSPNTYKYRYRLDSGSWSSYTTGINVTTTEQEVLGSSGLFVKWSADTGFTLGDKWTIKCSNTDRFGGFPWAPEAGVEIKFGPSRESIMTVGGSFGGSDGRDHDQNYEDPFSDYDPSDRTVFPLGDDWSPLDWADVFGTVDPDHGQGTLLPDTMVHDSI